MSSKERSIKNIVPIKKVLFIFLIVHLIPGIMTISSLYGDDTFHLTSFGSSFTEIEFTFPDVEYVPIEVDGKEYIRLLHPESGYHMKEGFPELLSFSVILAIPRTGSLDLTDHLIIDKEILSDIPLFPSQGFNFDISEETGFLKDDHFYNQDVDYSVELIQISTPVIMRDFRLVTLTVNPLSYNPGLKELTIVRKLTLKVDFFANIPGENELQSYRNTISRTFDSIYRETILNYEQFRDPNQSYQKRSILVVYSYSQTILPLIDQYLAWKRNKGFVVNAINTQEYPTALLIKNYLQTAYNTWDNPPEYLVIIGSGNEYLSVPYFSQYGGHTDHPYSLLEGNDDLADILVGRVSITNSLQLATFLNKLFNYERTPYMDNTNWYQHSLLVGDPSTSGVSTINTSKFIKELMLTHNSNNTFTEVYAPPFPAQMYNGFNQGATFFSFRGLGGVAGWAPGENTLFNGYMLPNVTLITCGTLDFQGGQQVEPLFRMGTPTTPKGSITAIGMTTSLTATAFNNCLTGGFYYGIFADNMRTMGAALMRGKLHIWQVYANSHWSQALSHSYWANLIGDPSMDIWVETPKVMNASYDSSFPLGCSNMLVTVTDDQGNVLPEVWVTIRASDNTLNYSDYTDNSGMVLLFFDPEYSGPVNITVTKPDYIPHLGTVNLGNGAIVGFHNLISQDPFIAGNTVNIALLVKNHLSESVTGVNGSISANSEYINIISDISSFGNIPAGETAVNITDFVFEISPDTPSEHQVLFELLLSDTTGNNWTSSFPLTIQNGYLVPGMVEVIDSNNGVIDPDEEVDIAIDLTNQGSVGLEDIYGILRSNHYQVSVIDSIGYFGDIAPNQTLNNYGAPFTIYIAEYVYAGSSFNLELELFNNSGFLQVLSFPITIGLVTVNDPLGPDAYGYWVFDQQDSGYLEHPEYSWIEIAPQLGGNGINTGLQSDFDNNQQVISMDLPFTFRFYGIEYDVVSICANGWISFGITEQTTHRNWRLPGPLGPNAIVAAFWDNLSLANGGVYTYYDSDENIFIIQWQNARNVFGNVEETFQIILYDPMFYYTSTADGPIKIQYKVFNNVNDGANNPGGIGNWGNYSTIGIADHTGAIGLEYTFNNQYPTAAMPLTHHTAIYFTTGTVGQGAPYVAIDEFSYTGNTNTLPQYGELISLDMTLTNLGDQPAYNVSGTITSDSQYITIIDNSADFGFIDINGAITLTDAYSIQISENIPHMNRVYITLNLAAAGNMHWTHNFYLDVEAPNLITIVPIIYDPLPGGNGNGIIDPGEELILYLPIKNSSNANSPQSITIDITSNNPLAVINNISATTFYTLPGGETLYPAISLSISNSASIGTVLLFNYTFQTGNYTFSGTFTTAVIGLFAQIGAGTATNANTEACPINIHYRSLRGQAVYTKHELNAAGITGPGTIIQLGFHVTAPPLYALPNFIVRMKHTYAPNASSHDYGPFTTVYSTPSYIPNASGWHMLTLTEPFIWNGIDNLLVDTAFSQAQSFNSSGQVFVYYTENGYRFSRMDNYDQTNSVTTQISTKKPQVRMMIGSYINDDIPRPENLSAQLEHDHVYLEWESTETVRYHEQFDLSERRVSADYSRNRASQSQREIGFNVYRNGILLNDEPLSITEFFDYDIQPGANYFYFVKAVLDGNESIPSNIVALNIAGQAATPIFSPPGGYYNTVQTLAINSDTENTIIYYTTDGSEPNTNSILYTEPFDLTPDPLTIVKARAYADNYLPSEVAVAIYYYLQTIPTPDITPRTGIFYQPITVNISLPSDIWTIHFTLDGSEPNQDSYIYDEPFPIEVSTTVKAKAFAQGWEPSLTATANYVLLNPPRDLTAQANGYDVYLTWEAPLCPDNTLTKFNQQNNPTRVNRLMEQNTPEANYRETKTSINRQTLISYRIYRSIGHPGNMQLLAELGNDATTYNDINLNMGTYHYKIKALYLEGESLFSNIVSVNVPATANPIFSPEPGHYAQPVEVTISTVTENADIYYTVDGSDPDEDSIQYIDPIYIDKDTTIKAIAISANWGPSNIVTGEYIIDTNETEFFENELAFDKLHNAYPNPFNPVTKVTFTLKNQDHVTIQIYNIAGRRVVTLVDNIKEAGLHAVLWKGDNDSGNRVSSGLYFIHMKTAEYRETIKVLMLK